MLFRGRSIPGGNAAALRMISPAGAFYGASFALPMVCLFVLSFWRAEGFAMIPDFTLSNYAKIAVITGAGSGVGRAAVKLWTHFKAS